MKRIIETDDKNGGLEAYLGEKITVFCMRYIYTGKLAAITAGSIELTDAAIVYETGALGTEEWEDAQKLPHKWNIAIASIESFGELK
jgi:hypothetical protein